MKLNKLYYFVNEENMSNKNKNKKLVVYKADDESEEEEIDEVRVIDNNIFFYCPVTTETILQLTMHIKKITKQLQIHAITYGVTAAPINLYINSEGGEVHAALSVLDLIYNNVVPIYTIISGVCMSAATLISIMGRKRYITPNSYMLIHNMSSTFWGKMHEFEDEMANMVKLTEHLKNIYLTHGNIKSKQLDTLLKKDLLLDPSVSLKYGFVDQISII